MQTAIKQTRPEAVILTYTDAKKHSVRYDIKSDDITMSVYVPKSHPVLAGGPPWPTEITLTLEA